MLRSFKSPIFFGILFLLCASACTKEKTETLLIENVVISAKGPVSEGSNTVQGVIANTLNEFCQGKGIDPSKVNSAKLKKITLSVDDTANFDLYSSINIQFVSDKTDMFDVALVNKVQPGSRQLVAELSAKQNDLLEMIRQDKFTIVADANLTKDSNADIEFRGNIEIELKY